MATTDQQVADPVVRLEPNALSVEPGGEVRAVLEVRNAGRVVERFDIEVLGPAAEFATVVPGELSLLPDKVGQVDVVVRPPVGPDAPAGDVPIGVRVVSGVDGYHASVAEGQLSIGAVHAIESRLVPLRPRGRWRGRYVVRVANTGNATTEVLVAPRDDDQRLGFAWAPQRLRIARGEVGRSFLAVRPRSPFFFGRPEKVPFGVELERTSTTAGPDPSARSELVGQFEQRSVGPTRARGLVVLLLATVMGTGALIALWPRQEAIDPADAAESPPGQQVTIEEVAPTASDPSTALRLVWSRTSNTSNYTVTQFVGGTDAAQDQVEEAVPVDAAQNTLEVEGLDPSTRYCFTVTPSNGAGDGRASAEACGTTETAPLEPTDGTDDGAGGGGEDGESTEDDGAGTETDDDGTGDDDALTTQEVQGFYAVLGVFPIGDLAVGDAPIELLEQLRNDNVEDVRLQDSRNSAVLGGDDEELGLFVVYRDGFESFEEARTFCILLRADDIDQRCDPVDPSGDGALDVDDSVVQQDDDGTGTEPTGGATTFVENADP